MVKIELTKEEQAQIVGLIESSSVQIGAADKALILLKKFKEAKD